MTSLQNRHAVAVLLAGGLLTGTALGAHATELGFFEALFGSQRQAPPAVQPNRAEDYGAGVHRQHDRRAVRPRPRTRYVALDRAEPLKVTIGDRQKALDMSAGPAAALMKDETLQPGDIVVLSTGARVFTGEPDKRHTMRDFSPIDQSGYVDRGTRRQLAAMMAPAVALPADQARRVVERPRKLEPVATPAVKAVAMRIINPWKTAP